MKIYKPSDGREILSKKNIIIFDFDGVLVDSVEIKTSAFASIYHKYGEEVKAKVILHHEQNGGMSRYDKFKHYHNEFLGVKVDESILRELSATFSSSVVNRIVDSKEVEGVTEILNFAKSQEIICTIASAAPKKEVIEIVKRRGWNKFFKFVLGSPITKEDNINIILNKSKSIASKAIFFGDSPNDLLAAKKCNVDFMPINYLAENDFGFRDLIKQI